jgi:hypothetical protein
MGVGFVGMWRATILVRLVAGKGRLKPSILSTFRADDLSLAWTVESGM